MLNSNQTIQVPIPAARYSWIKRSTLSFVFTLLFSLGFIVNAHAPAPGVEMELRFEEGTGTTAGDNSGNSHPGTLTNGPTWVVGKYGQGVNLDGTNDYINIPDHANFTLNPTQSYTWSCWVKNTNFNQWSTLWSQTADANNILYFYTHTTTDAEAGPVTNGISLYWYTGGNQLVVHSTNNVLTAGQWSYVAVTFDGSQTAANKFSIYVNGVDVTQRNDVVSSGTLGTIDPTNIRVGSNQPYGEYMNGAVDEVRYYRRALSLAEIQSDMNIGNTPDTQNPTAAITAPANGATVSGTTTVSANATDNVGVAGVQFLLDGVNLGAEDITSPYSVSWNTTTASNGSHSLTARSRDAAGNTFTSTAITVTVSNDTQAPAVNITSPTSGATVSGTLNVDANASDNVAVVGVQFLLDGVNLGAEDLVAPYTVSWNSATASNGNHSLTARARDAAGNTTTSAAIPVTVFNNGLVAAYGFNENTGTTLNDNSGNGNTGTFSGNPVWSGSGKFGAALSFNGTSGIVNVADANSLDLTNGMTLEAWVNASDLTNYRTVLCKENGTTNLVYALSANNNTSGAANQRPNSRIRVGTTTTTATGTTKLTVNTWVHLATTYDGTTVRFYINGIQVSTAAATGSMANTTNQLRIGGSTALGGQYFAGLIDEVRIYNRALSAAEIQTDMNTPIAPDVTAPTVSITAPAEAATVNGTVNVNANASDNISVIGVQFKLDGVNLGAEDLTAPYSVSWNTTTATNGAHTLTAVARDAAGNTTTSTIVNVTVSNDSQAPAVSITAPATGSTVSGTINVDADATDNVGVVGVQFLLDGVNLGTEDLTAPYTVSWNTATASAGAHTLTARARDAAGNTTTSSGIAVTVFIPDTQNPTASITAPANGATVTGSVNITANATDNVGVVGVQFLLDGVELDAEDLTAPYSISWNTLLTTNGAHTLAARARDAAGNVFTSTAVNVTVNNDTQAPTVSITSPADAATVSATINLNATATDNVGVAGVQFQLDGVNLGAEDLVAPYTISWNTGTASNGAHTLTAIARDAAGNTTTSAVINVTVFNDTQAPTVSISAPANASTVSNTVSITASAADNIGVAGVQFIVDGVDFGAEVLSSPYTISWNTTAIANGTHNIAARARDAAGNTTTSTTISVTVQNADAQAPTVSITAPASSATVSGTINVNASASDNVGVAGVQFQLDGVNLGAEDVSAPYGVSWNTITASNGSHTLTAIARDAAGNTTTSTGITVTVSNDVTAPTVSITAPANGATVSGSISVSANASDNIGVVGVQFQLNGVNLGAEDVSAPYSISWTTTTAPNGVQTLTAIARDAAGNTTTSSVINVTVSNDLTAPTASITAPANNATVTGTVSVTANASDNVGVVGVQFLLDGVNLGAEDLSAPYTASWNTTASTNGSHVLTARARDAAGNTFTSTAINVTVSNAPTNLIVALGCNEGSGTTTLDISGNSHNGLLTNGPTWVAGKYGQGINLNGSNNYLNIADHNNFTLVPTESYTWSCWVKNTNFNQWSTLWSQTQDNNNILYFYAHTTSDAEAGPVTNGLSLYWYTGGSQVVIHSTNNVLTAGTWSYVTVTYNGTLAQASRFSIYVNGVDVTQRNDVVSSGTIAGINPTNIRIGSNAPYGEYMNAAVDEFRYYKRALSAAEITTDMNTPIAPDAVVPTVNITAPADATVVSGTINVTANAADNIGVSGVQFILDGVNLGAEDLTAPYSVSWNTATASPGSHTLTAKARDAAGNNTTSAPVTVTINAPAPDYTFTLQTASKTVAMNGSTDFKADIVFLNGFTSNNIALSVSGLPAGVTGTYAVNPMTGAGTAQLNITATNATPGTYTLTLTAVAQSITRTQTATLTVTGNEDYTLNAVPPVQNVLAGSGVTYSIQVGEIGDYTSPVTLTLPGLPSGVTASFSPATLTPAGTSTLTITTTAAAAPGTYNLNVTGTSGAVVRTTPITLTISNIPPNTLQLPTGFSVMKVGGSGWEQPMGTAFTSDAQKMFVWERKGTLYVCNRNAQQLYDKQATPVLDIQTEVGIWGDHGLMSVALDPAFTNSGGYIYLLYVVDRKFLVNDGRPTDVLGATIGRVTRYKVIMSGGNMIVDPSPAERKILLGETKTTGVPVLHDSHGMGTLLFAADGTLIVSTGDGASYLSDDGGSDPNSYYQEALADGIIRANENVGSFRSQLLNCLNGKILRLDPATGDGVSSNPYYDPANPRSAKSRVWALGLRNPFRITLKPGTGSTNRDAGDIGELFVGDVGYNTWEELNVIVSPGQNCGWPLFEGLEPSSYQSLTTTNKDEPNNPLAGGSCGQYYTFKSLLKQATADGITTVYNPCNPATPIPNTTSDNRFFHRRPSLDWKHSVGPTYTRVGIWNGNNAAVAQVGTPESGATGSTFIGNASVGGVWYTGTLFPEMYRNTYFHGDYGGQWLKNFRIEFTDQVKEIRNFATGFGAIISIVQNPADGTLYCVDLGDNSVKRISYGGNQFPIVRMTSDKKFGPSTLAVNFTGDQSSDPEGANLTYLWNFGDNTTSTAANPPVHNFTAVGPKKFVVTLTVTDNFNASSVDSIIISVNNTPPTVNITSPLKNSTYRIGPDTTYTLTAAVNDAEHVPGQLKYQWQTILRHNNHEHPGPIDTARATSSAIARVGCNGDTYYYMFKLTVTDAAGLSTTDSAKIYPDCPSQPLIVLRDFSVTPQNDRNLVKWSTESSWQLRDFEVEVSADNRIFTPINKQTAVNMAGKADYNYSDTRLPAGVKYYRLKMIEVGSNVRYSGVVKTFTEESRDQLQISPNPVTSNFYIRYDALEKGNVQIRFSDMSGRIITTMDRSVNKGQNIIYLQSQPNWNQGTYLVTVQQGSSVQHGKLMKY